MGILEDRIKKKVDRIFKKLLLKIFQIDERQNIYNKEA